MLKHFTKKASYLDAFFVFVIFTVGALPVHADSCSSSQLSMPESATVKWVYDGDTLLLKDQRKIRIIGIDTPETKHHQQKAQAYGAKAREELRALLKKFNNRVSLRYGQEKKDRYSRTLAHVYLPDGTNISNWMLERGYASTLAFPPNITLAKCYKKAEASAQSQTLRIWKYKNHQIRQAKSLPYSTKGYVRLQGEIIKVKRHKKSIVMTLQSQGKSAIKLKIKKRNFQYFKHLNPERLRNQSIIVSGILKRRKGKRMIYLSYPTQLEIAQGEEQPKTQNHQTTKESASIKWSSQ